ncbi:MAG: zinc ribbon domain-containing protein [Candidatus Caldarchaeum sp.]|nr:zinc ribbon domain-containing protein [Candidatus Caldarchaeum sp.]
MNNYIRLASAALASFAIMFLLSTMELSSPQPTQVILISMVLAAVASGFAGGSALKAAVGAVIGGVSAFILGFYWGVSFWSPSPVPMDLPIIRSLLIGATALSAAAVGLVASKLLARPRSPAKKAEAVKPVKKEEVELEAASELVLEPPVEPGNRICKFCSSVIPAESVFCPMCGARLVEKE